MATASATSHAPIGNTDERYGSVAKAFHWSIALAIIALIPLGIVANELPYDTSEQVARKALLFSIHKTLGVSVLFLALARIAWAISQPKPMPLHPERRLETALAETVHWLLYGSLVLVPLSGWVSHAASQGFAPIWWPLGQSLPFVPKSEALYRTASSLHIVFERVLVVSLLLHVAGALKHHFWDRDPTLRRMTRGQPELPPLRAHGASLLPPAAALLVVAGAVGVGAVLGLYGARDARATEVATTASAPADAPAEPSAGWTVQEGTLAIAVQQLGSRVEGSFAAWDAVIAFEEEPDASGAHGAIEVTVDVSSLTLGSVTSQALGGDFFAADEFPRAVFAADIVPAPDGGETDYLADGTLTLRGAEVSVALPFDLALDGETAAASGIVTVDRRDFGIGQGFDDPGTLAFEVEIAVELDAARAD